MPDRQEITAAVTLTTGAHTRLITMTLYKHEGENTAFLFEELPACDTSLELTTVNRMPLRLTGVQFAADENGLADLGVLTLTEPTPTLRYPVRFCLQDEELSVLSDDFSFTVVNEKRGSVLEDAEVSGNTLTVYSDSVDKGDLLRVTAAPKANGNWAQLYPAEATVTVNGVNQLAPCVELCFTEKENIVYSFTTHSMEWQSFLVGIYDAQGELLKPFVPNKTRAEGGIYYIAPGDYTLVAMKENSQLSPLPRLSQYEALGVTDNVLIQAVTVPELGHASFSGSVPTWKYLPLYGETVVNATITARDWARPGGTKLVEFAYSLPEEYEGVEKSFSISLRPVQSYSSSFDYTMNQGVVGVIDSAQGVSCSDPEVDFRCEIGTGDWYMTVHTRACSAVFSFLVDPAVDYSFTSRVDVQYQTEHGPYPLGSARLDFADFHVGRIESPVTMSVGYVHVSNAKYGANYLAELYVDGELESSCRLTGTLENLLPYQLERVCAAHSFQVVIKDGEGGIVYEQEPYSVTYLATDASEPVPASLKIYMYNSAAMDGCQSQRIELDLLNSANNIGKQLNFYYSPGALTENGALMKDGYYDFILSFTDSGQVDPDSVRLWLYKASGYCAGSISMEPHPDGQIFYGHYVLKAHQATVEDRICGFALEYRPAEEGKSLIVSRPETTAGTGGQQTDTDYAEIVAGFAPVSNDEVEARIQAVEDELGVPLPEPVRAAVLEFYYEFNATVSPYYELYKTIDEFDFGLGIVEEQLTNCFSFFAQVGQIPAGFTEQDAQAAGWHHVQVTGEETGIYVRQEGGYIYCYDFGTGQITRLPLSDTSAEPQPVMLRSDAPAQFSARPAFRDAGRPAILLGDGDEGIPDASQIESQFYTTFSATESLLSYLISEVNGLRAAAELADQAGQEYRDLLRAQQAELDWIETQAPHGSIPVTEMNNLRLAQSRLDLAEAKLRHTTTDTTHWSSSEYDSLWAKQFENIEQPKVFSEETQAALEELIPKEDLKKTQEIFKKAKEEQELAEESKEKAQTKYDEAKEKLQTAKQESAQMEVEAKQKLSSLKNTGSAEQAYSAERKVSRIKVLGQKASDLFSSVRSFFSETGLFRVTKIFSILGGILAFVDFAIQCFQMEEVKLTYFNRLDSYEYQLGWATRRYAEGLRLSAEGKISEEQMGECQAAFDAYIEQLLVYKDAIEHEYDTAVLNWFSSLLAIVLLAGGPIGSLVALGTALGVICYSLTLDLKEEKVKLLDLEWPLEKACTQAQKTPGPGPDPDPDPNRDPNRDHNDNHPDKIPSPALHDPAGIVYEAVLSNAVEGATARIYYRADDGSEALWDAENYDQLNPQQTDAKGNYMWLTPEGKWKVRVSMPGYLDGDSELDPVAVDGWLPVLPPQIHVNIPLVSTAAPAVNEAAAAPDALTVCFSQYMDIAAFDGGAFVSVTQNGEDVPVALSWPDAEESPTQPGVFYGRVLKLARADGQPFSGEDITVSVGAAALNYAGTALGEDFRSAPLTVAQVVGSLEHSYPNRFVAALGEEQALVVRVLDTLGNPMEGVTVTVRAELGGTLDIPASAVSDALGRAVFPVTARSSGYDVLHFASGLLASANMNTRVLPPQTAEPDKPTARYADGSPVRDHDLVEPGTALILETETPNATIYYTTDDTCPCTDSPSRRTYDGTPLVVTESTFLRVAAWTEAGGYSERLNLHVRLHEHTLSAVARVEPGCETAGHSAYWCCPDCGRCYADAQGTQEIALADTVLAPLGHEWGDWFETLAPTETRKGEEQRVCRRDPSHIERHELPDLSVTSYVVTVNVGPNGSAFASTAAAAENETVTVTASAYEGFELASIRYTAEGGEPQDITGTKAFTMPAAPVIIDVLFREIVPIVYTVTAGGGSTWTQNGGALSVTVKRSPDDSECFAHFAGVLHDGRSLDSGAYTAVSGSTVVTLKADTLQRLNAGAHTVTVLFDDGEASTTLTVKAAASGDSGQPSPKTGDDSGLARWSVLMTLSALALLLACAVLGKRRKKVF